MCGIIARQERTGGARGLVDGLRSLACRGPDRQDEWAEGATALGCARLVLWQEGESRQPRKLGNEVGVFNGELFNLDVLRSDLSMPGASEIEILMDGIRRRGIEFLTLVDGQFAGIIYSRDSQELVAFRDGWGIIPLYFASLEDHCVVASTVPALRSEGITNLILDREGIAQIAGWWAAIAPVTAWQGIRQMPPGGWARFRGGQLTATGDWTVARASPKRLSSAPNAEFVGMLKDELDRAVMERARGDVPWIATLSGGVDSTVIAAIGKSHGLRNSYGLCLRDDDPIAVQQQTIAHALGLEHTLVVASPPAIVDNFRPAVLASGIPITRLGPVGMNLLAKRVHRDGFRVALSGEGADELFGGYDSFRVAALASDQLRTSDWDLLGASEFEIGEALGGRYWRFLAATSGNLLRQRLHMARFIARYFRNDITQQIAKLSEWAAEWDGAADPVEAVRHMEIEVLLRSYLLTVQADHAWAPEAVEMRYPWLANGVTTLGLSVPARMMLQQGSGKVPVFALARTMLADKPVLNNLDFTRKAYRIDCAYIIKDHACFAALRELCSNCPPDIMNTPEILRILDGCRATGHCNDADSSLFVLTASLGILCA